MLGKLHYGLTEQTAHKRHTGRFWANLSSIVLVFFVIVFILLLEVQTSKLTILTNATHSLDTFNSSIQRLIRLEITMEPSDSLVSEIDEYLIELTQHIEDLNLPESASTSTNIETQLLDITISWSDIKDKLDKTRADGWEATNITYDGEKNYYEVAALMNSIQTLYQSRIQLLLMSQHALDILVITILSIALFRVVYYIHLIQHSKKYAHLAYEDSATGLYNRSRCERLLKDTILSPKMNSGILIFDLNDLKKVNDTLGHLFGDALIRNFAAILREGSTQVGTEPLVARYGGDEFVAYFHQVESTTVSDYLDFIASSCTSFNADNQDYQISYAVGVAESKDYPSEHSLYQLLSYADAKMYANKFQMKRKDS
ncbi:MAG: GGDEF domain-containing protein [Eubacteriales bacterium]